MRDIVRDERRGDGPKATRREAVAPGSPPDSVASLAGAPGTCCAPRLASGLPGAIKVDQSHVIRLYTVPVIETRFHTLPDGRRIAFRFAPGAGPALVFLPGYKSDTSGSKAQAVLDWARERGRACLLLDYSGCGESSGAFADGTLSRWTEEVIALIEARCDGQVVLIGSSMGGWLMLLVALALGPRVAALVGIAAAPDFTEWGLDAAAKAELVAGRTVLAENPYGAEPTPTHPGFFADAQAHLRLHASIAIGCPVRLLHGQADTDVPWEVSLRLARALRSAEVQTVLVKDGDHRLSRPADIALLLRTLADLP